MPQARSWAQAYHVREPARWQALVELGQPDALATYPRDLSADQTPKDCCVRTPEPPPRDVVDPPAGLATG